MDACSQLEMSVSRVHVRVQGDQGGSYEIQITNLEQATIRDLKRAAEAEDGDSTFGEILLNGKRLQWAASLHTCMNKNSESCPFVLVPYVSTESVVTIPAMLRAVWAVETIATALKSEYWNEYIRF